jgi:hypothetical protein
MNVISTIMKDITKIQDTLKTLMNVISTIMKDITKIKDTLSARLVSFLPRNDNAITVGT